MRLTQKLVFQVADVEMLIGREYCEGTFQSENSKFVGEAFREIVKVNKRLFDAIPYRVDFTDEDPYPSAKGMRKQVVETGSIRIFTGWSGHPFLTHEENNIGRAVHDVWAHMVCGCPFTFQGEYNSYLEQRRHYPKWVWGVLFAEIPAQTAAYYYKNSFDYDQRAIEAPDLWMKMCLPLVRDYSKTSVLKSLMFAA